MGDTPERRGLLWILEKTMSAETKKCDWAIIMPLPFLLGAEDYHNLSVCQDFFRHFSSGIKVHELSEDVADEVFPEGWCGYVGVVYKGKRPSTEKIKELVRDGKFFDAP